jgi:hypothetical protein
VRTRTPGGVAGVPPVTGAPYADAQSIHLQVTLKR